jgi:MarR family transcriptional regulator for hemolysin
MMACKPRRGAAWHTPTSDSSAPRGKAPARAPSDERLPDQFFAEPIVRPARRSGQTDEAAFRHLLQEIAARPPLRAKDDPNTDDPYAIVQLLHETARLWRGPYEREVRAQLPGMTLARCSVLTQLAQHEGVNQATLAHSLDIRPISLARLLDRLEAAGFIARVPDPDDRRAYLLVLTAKALPIVESIYDLTRKTYDDLPLGISKAEAIQLHGLLCRIRSNLRNHRSDVPSSEPLRSRRDA